MPGSRRRRRISHGPALGQLTTCPTSLPENVETPAVPPDSKASLVLTRLPSLPCTYQTPKPALWGRLSTCRRLSIGVLNRRRIRHERIGHLARAILQLDGCLDVPARITRGG